MAAEAHTEVGNLRKELLPEIEKKIDEKTVELEFTKAPTTTRQNAGTVYKEQGAYASLLEGGWSNCQATYRSSNL